LEQSVWHFTQEAFEDLTHADSRLWRTLGALLFKPGYLTREFLEGRRARYLPPLRLYLVLSVAFFLIASVTSPKKTQSDAEPIKTPAQSAQQIQSLCPKFLEWGTQIVGKRFGEVLSASCDKTLQSGGHELQEAVLHNIPRVMFIFLPVLALFSKLLYWRPPRYYIEHLLFYLHNHSFVFLLFGLERLADALIPAPSFIRFLGLAAPLYAIFYLYRSMRRVYGENRARTAGKFTVLALIYLAIGIVTLVATTAFSFVML